MLNNLATCQDNYGVGGDNEWGNNMVSQKAVMGPSGRVGYRGSVDAPPVEAALKNCESLADAAIAVGVNATFGIWGSEGGEGFEPYWVATHAGWKCERITSDVVRAAFGGTLYPKANIEIRTLDGLSQDLEGQEADDEQLVPWRQLIHWFTNQRNFTETAYVSIDKRHESMEGGCVFPRLLIGRLSDGSLAGLFGVVVYT